jgi:CheY-like chemotaxis protein
MTSTMEPRHRASSSSTWDATSTFRTADEAAIAFAPDFRPQLVILDVSMPPGIDGYQTAFELKKQPWSDSASFVAHSGSSDPLVRQAVERAGLRFYVAKPAKRMACETILAALRDDEMPATA